MRRAQVIYREEARLDQSAEGTDDSPLRSKALDASQQSSKDDALWLMMSDTAISSMP